MRILITGAQGFVGRYLVGALEQSHEVFALYRGEDVPIGKAVWLRCQLGAALQMNALPHAIDAIVHLAQSRRYRDFPEGVEDVFAVNVASTVALLRYATRAGARQFILASTASVYTATSEPQAEDAPLAPEGFYAASKLAAEVLARPFSTRMKVCSLRLFFPYGPGQKERLMSELIGRVAGGRPVTLKGSSGGLVFNPTYISDVVGIIQRSLEEVWSGTLNVASPETMSIRDVAQCIGTLLGKPPLFETIEGTEPLPIVPDLAALGKRYALDSFTPFDIGLRATLAARQPG